MPRSTRTLSCCLLTLAVLLPGAGAAAETATRSIEPATVTMHFPEPFGDMERPAVEFNHRLHTTALEQEGCKTCHTINEKGLIPALTATMEVKDRDGLIDAFHNVCMDCHKERAASLLKAGPVTCGECHKRRSPGVSARVAMTFDYSLHGRHALAYPEKCESCHRRCEQDLRELEYEKGKEEACRVCHGTADEGKKLSLENASHTRCIGCHLERLGQELEAGPVLCVGCHDAEVRRSVKRLEDIPRLKRGQPDALWVSAPEGRSKAVPFNHLAHEQHSQICSDCHHQSLKKCSECHTIRGVAEGDGVTLERASHMTMSTLSCVGCHRQQTAAATSCAGCHAERHAETSERLCGVCHSGPPPAAIAENPPPALITEVTLDPLPLYSDDFPEEVTIEELVDSYEASKLPHGKIVAKLDMAIRESSLARTFHGSNDILCAGCHHHSPPGSRTPQCRACHGRSAHPTRDLPGLKAAYHRQCMGCHQRMGINKLGCTDCHAEREVQP